jgi:hypothetical protein
MPQKNPELTHSTLNVLEDSFIECRIGQDYPNAGEILESTKEEVLNTLLKILPKLDISIHEKSLLFAAARFEGRGYSTGLDAYEKLGEQISIIMLRRKAEILERKETKDLMPLVTEIVDLIINTLGEPTEEERRRMAESSDTGNASNSDQQDITKSKTINGLKAGKGWQEGIEMANRVCLVNEISDLSTVIGKRLRTILKRNNAMEFAGRFRSGKLLAKRFVRIRTLNDRNPFARRIIKSNQSYAFAVAADVSGSMFDNFKARETLGSYALSSMFMVGEALRIAGVPRSMIIFGDAANVVAPMGKNSITFEQLGNDKAIRKAKPGGTEIAKAIDACVKELSTIRAERKILIVLTDGQSDISAMEEAHKRALAQNIEPLGITLGGYDGCIMEKVFSREKNTAISNTKDKNLIGKAFIDILKASIKKST